MTCIDRNARASAQELLQHSVFAPLRECLNGYGLNDRYDLVGKMSNKSLIQVKDKNDLKMYEK